MWEDIMMRAIYTKYKTGGVAPLRHELANQAYTEKIKALYEAEQRTATTGMLASAMSRLWGLTSAALARVSSGREVRLRSRTPARRALRRSI